MKNCSKKATAMTLCDDMKPYGYTKAPAQTQEVRIVSRWPKISERYPIVIPPLKAPRLATTCVTVIALGEYPYCCLSKVGYRS